MKRTITLARAVCVASLIFTAGAVQAQDYEPQDGDAVVLYINKFKKADFDKAKEIMVGGFGKAMSASGQTRLTYWIADPASGEIIGISFFKKGHSVDEWHDHAHRKQVLDRLTPLRSEPQTKRHLEVVGSHDTGK